MKFSWYNAKAHFVGNMKTHSRSRKRMPTMAAATAVVPQVVPQVAPQVAPQVVPQAQVQPVTATPVSGPLRMVGGAINGVNYVRSLFQNINDSKLFIGIMMITMNIAVKYVDFKFSKTQEEALRNGIARELIIFAVAFMGTRDIVLALLLTGAFMIMAQVLFNDCSRFCLLPRHFERVKANLESKQVQNEAVVTPEEEKRAIDILERAERQRESSLQSKITSYFSANV